MTQPAIIATELCELASTRAFVSAEKHSESLVSSKKPSGIISPSLRLAPIAEDALLSISLIRLRYFSSTNIDEMVFRSAGFIRAKNVAETSTDSRLRSDSAEKQRSLVGT